MTRTVAITAFAGAILAFALPFGAVSSCDGAEVRFTGVDLVTRSVPGETPADAELAKRVESDTWLFAGCALLAAVAGIVLVLLGIPRSGLCAGLGLVSMQLLLYAIVLASDDGKLRGGFGLAMLAFAVAGAAALVESIRSRWSRGDSAWPALGWTLAVILPPLGLLVSASLAVLVWVARRLRSALRASPVGSLDG